MLKVVSGTRGRDCGGRTRREFLQIGALGIGGLTLPGLLAARAATVQAGGTAKDVSVVLLFLTGGPSQIETFDPKMTAPSEVRSVTGEVATSLPGVTFGGTFTELSRWADRMAVVRSFTHGNADHTGAVQDVIRGGVRAGAGLGAIFSRLYGTSNAASGMPSHVYLAENEQDTQYDKERLRLLEATGPGSFGPAYAPFEPFGDGQVNRNMAVSLPRGRIEDRRALRQALERFQRKIDRSAADLGKFEQQAFDLIFGNAKQAFDLSKEDPRLVERYDTSRHNTALRIGHRAAPIGHQLLLARRLCEAGCGFVTIHNPGWDMHGGPTQFNMPDGMKKLGQPLDHAVAMFLEDVEQRGLSEKILLVITGEFGRTPKVTSDGGRDHWPRLSTLALAGGALPMGRVIGRSNSHAEAPDSNPVTPENLLATVLHVLFDVPALRLLPNVPRELAALIERSEPIRELIG